MTNCAEINFKCIKKTKEIQKTSTSNPNLNAGKTVNPAVFLGEHFKQTNYIQTWASLRFFATDKTERTHRFTLTLTSSKNIRLRNWEIGSNKRVKIMLSTGLGTFVHLGWIAYITAFVFLVALTQSRTNITRGKMFYLNDWFYTEWPTIHFSLFLSVTTFKSKNLALIR